MPITINGDGTVTGISAGGLPDGSISTADIADDAVTLAKLSTTGTPGAGNFLRGDNSWQEAGGGAWNVITSTNITSTVTGVEFTSGIDSTYASYAWIIAGLKLHANNYNLYLYVKTNTGSYHTGGSDYKSFSSRTVSTSSSWSGLSSNGAGYILVCDQGGFVNLEMRLDNPTQTSNIKPFYWNGGHLNNSSTLQWSAGAGALFANNNAITAVKFDCGGGNMTEGRITMYGIAHA